MDFLSDELKGVSYRKRIHAAVKDTHFSERLLKCEEVKETHCGSVYCDKCRQSKQRSLFYRFNKYFVDNLKNDEALARERLRWVSVLHSVVAIDENDEMSTINNVCQQVEIMKNEISNLARCLKRNRNEKIWLRGGIHLEIVDYRSFLIAAKNGVATEKEKTLTGFIQRMSNEISDFYVLVHFHALADKRSLTDSEFSEIFTNRWCATSRQVDVQTLWENVKENKRDSDGRLIKDNLGRRIVKSETDAKVLHSLIAFARYCYAYSNHRLQYARNWSHGKYIAELSDDGLVELGELRASSRRLTLSHIRLLVLMSDAVNGEDHKGLEVRCYG